MGKLHNRRPLTIIFCLVLCLLLTGFLSIFFPYLTAESKPSFVPSKSNGSFDLWVDAESGSDANSGLSADDAFQSIQKAANQAEPGTMIHIRPGIYRESIRPKNSGSQINPITYIAENGPGTVVIRGSTPASALLWTELKENNIDLPTGVDPTNIYFTDLSSWKLSQTPGFVVLVDQNDSVVSRIMPAREPDWQVKTEWKYAEYWWQANGGSEIANCDPITNLDHDCDLPSRSYNQLTDTLDDKEPLGIEQGNLLSFGNLIGATLVAMDAHHSHYVYRSTIIQHNVENGRVTIDRECENEGQPGLGWGSKYYLESHPALLDQPGEWWFDQSTGRFYIWSPTGEDPSLSNIEISRLDIGFDLSNRSYITLDGLRIELFNENTYQIVNQKKGSEAHGNQIKNSFMQYADKGIVLYHYVQETTAENAIADFLLEDTEILNMNSVGFDSSFWWAGAPSPEKFSYAGVRNLILRNNEIHDIGFNSRDRSAVGLRVFFPDELRFEGNHLYNIAQNGAHFHLSLIDSDKVYDLKPEEIKLGNILIKDNIFEKTCQAASDCGGLKIGGSGRPYTHVFKNVLVTGNIFRHIFGWSYVSIQRQLNTLGDGNGFYLDNASGVHVYRNIAYNNSGAGYKLSCYWRDGEAVFYNNIAANNYLFGWKFTGSQKCDDHGGSVNTRLVNNILINNGVYGFQFSSSDANEFGNLVIDHNLYFRNGWDEEIYDQTADIQLYIGSQTAEYLSGLKNIQERTNWEVNGVEKNPFLQDFSLKNHTRYVYSWPAFQPSWLSVSVEDTGSETIPDSLSMLLEKYRIDDIQSGSAYDIGRYEISNAFTPKWIQFCMIIAILCLALLVGIMIKKFISYKLNRRI